MTFVWIACVPGGTYFAISSLALGVDFAQRANIRRRFGFFERAPLHERGSAELPAILRLIVRTFVKNNSLKLKARLLILLATGN
jgi:hypothetical protein